MEEKSHFAPALRSTSEKIHNENELVGSQKLFIEIFGAMGGMSAVIDSNRQIIYANNEFQMMQFLPLIIIPQIFFSGLISLDTLPYHLGYLSKIMPVYYACDALNAILIKGLRLGDVLPQIAALFAFIAIFFALNIVALKKYRRI